MIAASKLKKVSIVFFFFFPSSSNTVRSARKGGVEKKRNDRLRDSPNISICMFKCAWRDKSVITNTLSAQPYSQHKKKFK